ncbi:MAG: GGDEF domain-containing protein [Prochlorothrix sp.]
MAHLKESLEREYRLGRIDPLTNLPNSRLFYEEALLLLNLCHRNGRSVTLAYVDLDNFKAVNDTLGHLQGDDLLRQVADAFRNNFRASDLIARMGGDEFIILLPETAATDAEVLLKYFLDCIVALPQFQACAVTASIGAVSCGVAPTEIEQILGAADQLMYSVKRTGKNRVVVEMMPNC